MNSAPPPSPAWTTRRAGQHSLPGLADLHAAGFAGYATPIHMDASALSDRIRSENIDLWSSFTLRHAPRHNDDDNDHGLDFANNPRGHDDGNAAGEDVALVLVARRGASSRIASMGVPTHARGNGWGRRALDVAIAEAVERGDSLQLDVLTDNHPAVSLYASAGFVIGRTLVGYEGTLTSASGHKPPSARGSDGDVRRIPLQEAAARVAQHASDLPWQLDAPSLYGLSPAWQAWTNGPATAITRHRGDTLHLISLLTHPDHRRQGHARALLHHVATVFNTRDVRIISIVPEGTADQFARHCGLTTANLRQYEMTLRN